MATDVRVTCINKHDRNDPHTRITHIGGLNNDGSRWKMTEDAAIQALGTQWNFYVLVSGHKVYLIVAYHNGRPYLKTQSDGFRPDNLLSLPECP